MWENLFASVRPLAADATTFDGSRAVSLNRIVAWLRDRKGFVLIAIQLGAVLLVADRFDIEENFGFSAILPLIFFGFLVNAALPLRFRLPFFLLLSLAAIVVVLGMKQGLGLILVGLALFALCHIPVKFVVRIVLIVAAGIALAAVRAGWIETSWEALPLVIIPILGAMFMFRLMIYLYDLRHEKEKVSIWQRLGYFFMLPNVCFLLFPVVDYQTYRRSYYDAAPEAIYQKGLVWIMRGIVHLLLYRVVYHYLLPTSAEVADLAGLVQFMLATYALYLRISGLFHLIIGVMCLFGFNLPETHHLYYLASSFNDYWRRINIYWKDFMLKLFYYPALMKFRKFGIKTAIVLATMIVFSGTWLLHSYQWFWLQGSFPLTVPDALFWGILGLLVVVNSLREASQGRKRTLKKQSWSPRQATIYSLKVVATFTFICILWSLWSSETLGDWISLIADAAEGSLRSWIFLGAGLVLLTAIGVAVQYAGHRGWNIALAGPRSSTKRASLYVCGVSIFLLAAGSSQVEERLAPEPAEWLASIRTDKMSSADLAQMERGYYEGLLDAGGFVTVMRTLRGMPEVEPFDESGGVQLTSDLRVKELKPNVSFHYSGITVRTNRWGMRDRDYTLQKPAGTYRIALLGASHVMGNGVENENMFDPVLEARLNGEQAGGAFEKYEVLNFSVTGYGPIQVAFHASEKLAPFSPDIILFFAHPDQIGRALNKFAWPVYRGDPITPEYLAALVKQEGLRPGMSMHTINRRLMPHGEDMLRWAYSTVVRSAEEIGAIPVWVYLPWVHEETDPETFDYLSGLARDAGFSVISLDGAYHGNRDSLQVAPWDTHPNAEAHGMLADRLYDELVANAERLNLPFEASISEPKDASELTLAD